jgi:Glycosyl hydrolases family 2, TIM barrel domain/Glycosyl hydrolases family 2
MRLLISVAACILLHTSLSSISFAQGSSATLLDLDGSWSVTDGTSIQSVTVPTTIPFTFGVSRWTTTFSLNLPQAPLVAYIHFDGIAGTATVLLNGVIIGNLLSFTEKRLDVASTLNLNGLNSLEVDIDDRLLPDTIPGGDTPPFVSVFGNVAYTFPIAWAERPGIIRHASLVYSSHPTIEKVFAQPVITPDLSHADVSVRIRVLGASPTALIGLVQLTGPESYTGSCIATASLQASNELTCTIPLESPSLWSPNRPNLYDLWIELGDGLGLADVYTDKIGLRQISVLGNQVFLNNAPLFLRGITRHDLYPGRDFVADDTTIESDLLWIKQLGANYIRSIHYPPDARIARRADEIGLLLSEEIPAWAAFDEPAILPLAEEMLQAMVERDFNRASVIAWYVGCGRPVNATAYLNATSAFTMSLDQSRLLSFVFDNNVYLPSDIQSNVNMAKAAGMNVYVQNAYYFASVMTTAMPAMPTNMPVIVAEWSGSEGSDRGPLGVAQPGMPGVTSFPDYQLGGDGTPTVFEAITMLDRGSVWLPYVCSSSSTSPCISGLTYFNWQDIEWPGMPYFYPGHFPFDRNGLVYEDRGPKTWPLAVFQSVMAALPHEQ